jgi:hypothetical protein
MALPIVINDTSDIVLRDDAEKDTIRNWFRSIVEGIHEGLAKTLVKDAETNIENRIEPMPMENEFAKMHVDLLTGILDETKYLTKLIAEMFGFEKDQALKEKRALDLAGERTQAKDVSEAIPGEGKIFDGLKKFLADAADNLGIGLGAAILGAWYLWSKDVDEYIRDVVFLKFIRPFRLLMTATFTRIFNYLDDVIGLLNKMSPGLKKLVGLVKFLAGRTMFFLFAVFDAVKGFTDEFQKGHGLFDSLVRGVMGSIKEVIKGIVVYPLDFLMDLSVWLADAFGFEKLASILDSFSLADLWEEAFNQFKLMYLRMKKSIKELIPGGEDGSIEEQEIQELEKELQQMRLERTTKEIERIQKRISNLDEEDGEIQEELRTLDKESSLAMKKQVRLQEIEETKANLTRRIDDLRVQNLEQSGVTTYFAPTPQKPPQIPQAEWDVMDNADKVEAIERFHNDPMSGTPFQGFGPGGAKLMLVPPRGQLPSTSELTSSPSVQATTITNVYNNQQDITTNQSTSNIAALPSVRTADWDAFYT